MRGTDLRWRLIGLAFAIVPQSSAYDQWMAPAPIRYSQEKHFALTAINRGLTLKRRSANGWTLLWKAESPQAREPYQVHFAKDGRHIVLQDEWGSLGFGVVLAFLGPDGRTLKQYKLEEFLPKDDILMASMSVSSIWWASQGIVGMRANDREFAIITARKTYRCFDLNTGAMKPMTVALKSEMQQEYTNANRAKLGSKDPDERCQAAWLAWTLDDRGSISTLMKLLDDPAYSETGQAYDRYTGSGRNWIPAGTYKNYYVQIAAATILAKFDAKSVVPIFERKISKGNAHTAAYFMEALAESTLPEVLGLWQRLSKDRRPWLARLARSYIKRGR